MEKYLDKLLKQFMEARGIRHANVNSEEFVNEFCSWIKENKLVSWKFITLLDYMNGQTYDSFSVEIGKGMYDSLAECTSANIITPYSEGLENKTNGKVIKGELSACGFGHGPAMVTNGKLELIDSNINRFITHNPYTQSDIRNWEMLHNSGKNIAVGVYGSIYDHDINKRLKQMKELKDKLLGEVSEEYGVIDDIYCYALSSKRNR